MTHTWTTEPLPSTPATFQAFLTILNIPATVHDVLSLTSAPPPGIIRGLILCDKPDTTSIPQSSSITNDKTDLWFSKQTIRNICGTMALIHLCATLPILPADNEFAQFVNQTRSLSPLCKAKEIEKSGLLCDAHAICLAVGLQQDEDVHMDNVENHYAALVPGDNTQLFELDGSMEGPVSFKKRTEETFYDAAIRVIRDRASLVQDWKGNILAITTPDESEI